jgi:hypothetical protein
MDAEFAESHKCSRMFPYFEKTHQIPPDTLHSIALKESGKKHTEYKIRVVWPWTVNVEGKGYHFNTKREAIFFVRKQIIQGKENIDVGCMQINLKHHLAAFNSLNQAFDPEQNVAYGAKFLKEKYDQLGSWHKAIAYYHSATHGLGSKLDINKMLSRLLTIWTCIKILLICIVGIIIIIHLLCQRPTNYYRTQQINVILHLQVILGNIRAELW